MTVLSQSGWIAKSYECGFNMSGLFRAFGDESPSTEPMENLHLQKPRRLLRDHSSARTESVSFAAS